MAKFRPTAAQFRALERARDGDLWGARITLETCSRHGWLDLRKDELTDDGRRVLEQRATRKPFDMNNYAPFKSGKAAAVALIVADLRSEQWAGCSEEERDLLLELADRYESGEHEHTGPKE